MLTKSIGNQNTWHSVNDTLLWWILSTTLHGRHAWLGLCDWNCVCVHARERNMCLIINNSEVVRTNTIRHNISSQNNFFYTISKMNKRQKWVTQQQQQQRSTKISAAANQWQHESTDITANRFNDNMSRRDACAWACSGSCIGVCG